MNSKLTIGALAALFIAGAASTQPAYASINEEAVFNNQVRVEFRRSELSTEAGARQLLKRLERAARRACAFDGPALTAGRNYRVCKDSARAGAVRQINAPILTAIHDRPGSMQLATK